MLLTDIHVRSFTGVGIKPYLHSMAKLRVQVLREYPFYEDSDLYKEMQCLRKISSSKESIAVLIFDGTTLVGSSVGYPLSIEEPNVLKPFVEKNLPINSFFYFGDSILLKQYRGRGIGHHFFDAREAHVHHHNKYRHICFCVPTLMEDEKARPADYVPLTDFWRKRGFVHHPELHCVMSWKNIDEAHPSEKTMSFWIKESSL